VVASFSVHVTNAVYGRPAEGLPVGVYERLDGKWAKIGMYMTDEHGSLAVSRDTGEEMLARLELDMDAYFATLGVKPAYPVITLVFRVAGQRPETRVRLLAAPSAYVTFLEV
jgi:5-hydroxyisourate hydrolase